MLYNKIEELMRKTGVSAYQISRDTKIPQSAFSRWKKGESNPSLKKYQNIIGILRGAGRLFY